MVVLPFASVGPPSDLQLGLAEDVTAASIPHRQLRTVAARVARNLAQEQHGPADIGRSLGVDFVVDGSMRNVGGGVRIRVTMTDCATDAVTWSVTLDCDPKRACHIHDEIAFGVAQYLIAETARARLRRQAVYVSQNQPLASDRALNVDPMEGLAAALRRSGGVPPNSDGRHRKGFSGHQSEP